MKISLPSLFVKILKITGISIGSILLLLFLAPYIFPNTVADEIKKWTNSSIKGEVNFSKARLSFFNHFPSLTLSLHDFTLKGSPPYASDTLISAEKISFGINLKTLLFDKKIKINKIYLDRSYIDVKINEKGEANYNIYESKNKPAAESPGDTASTSLRLEKIVISNSRLIYNDKSVPMLIDAKNFNYEGAGDLSKAIFDLRSHMQAESLNFSFENEPYLTNKKMDADLITKINTNSLAFIFEKNDLIINKLGVQFNGKLDFLKNGYDIDLSLSSVKSDFHDLITALPPSYLDWLEKTKVKGSVNFALVLKGQYIASTNTMPGLAFNMKIRDGYIAYKDAPAPASNLMANLDVKIPSFNMDSMTVNMDSLFFTVEKNYFRMSAQTKGFTQPFVTAKADAQVDLEKLERALGIDIVDMKGNLNLKFNAEGKYATRVVTSGIRNKKDTIVTSIPKFNLESSLNNGYLKYKDLSQPITNINLAMHASCPDNDYKKSVFKIDTISAKALSNFINGSASVSSTKDFPLEANMHALINLAEIKQFYPIDSIELGGLLKFNVNTKGKYAPAKKLFPKTFADITWQHGSIQTKYYPHPIDNIEVTANASDDDGTMRGLNVMIQPVSFQFEGKPFSLNATLKNFDDLLYDVKANGEIDIGKIYQVFSRQGINVKGYAKMAVSLKGRQSDAMNARYDNLLNSGTIALKNLEVNHEYFPLPFTIREGLFSFRQDKMWFDKFLATYGKSDIRLDGFLQNVINYVLSDNGKLSGNFNLASNFINVDEFAAFSAPSNNKKQDSVKIQDTTVGKSSGVVMIPANLDLIIKANANKISYNGLDIQNFTGGLAISNAQIRLSETTFTLIGCNVNMDGLYGSTSATRAIFEYHIQAKDFDIKRAYNEVKLFHDLASSAASAQGIVSLDYNLKGRLNADMYPIYPSLTGGGVLSIKNVKVKGLKLFNAVSSKTEKQDIKEPDLSKIDFKTTIKNNLITLERTKFKTAGFRIRLEGQTSFDNKINFKMRIGLPPLGIIGIPMRITGSSDDPKVKLGKSDKDELAEKEDTEE
ncbi:MAG: AsmA family protein [Bacteroidetes bacterium]|nr:AsmA family protein [Bacteroidota bacterium]